MKRAVLALAALLVLTVGYVGVTFVQVVMASRRDGAREAEAIVVLGAAQYNGIPSPVLRARLDHALALYRDGVAPLIVLTGGRRPGDAYTEASAGRAYLLGRGVADDALLVEDRGGNSWESLAAAAALLRDRDLTQVVLVSSAYHNLRVEHIAGEVGLDGHASPAGARPRLGDVVRLGREAIAVAVGRLIGYGRLVDLDQRVEGALVLTGRGE